MARAVVVARGAAAAGPLVAVLCDEDAAVDWSRAARMLAET